MEPLQARVPEQRAPLRIGHVPDDRPVAVAARLRPHLEAMLDNEKKEALLEKAFGKKLGDDGGEKRNREGSVLAKYAPVSAVASEEEKEDEVMADADPPEASDSDEEDQE